jgi:hypothetical protein
MELPGAERGLGERSRPRREAATPSSAKAAVSKVIRRLEKRKLVTRVRSQRLSDLRLLMEDGSGEPYEPRSPERVEDRWLQLPHAYWLEGHYIKPRVQISEFLSTEVISTRSA